MIEEERILARLAGTALKVDPEGKPYGSRLFDQHATKLSSSAVSAEVAEARGYVSADTKAQLEREGFGSAQRRPPALVVPLWNVLGERAGAQVRSDDPRMVNGKPAKYETKAGMKMLLDVPPGSREHLGNPEVPLVITEGPIKADAAVSAGLCAVDLLGVWNWRGKNNDGGLVALADWEFVALNSRTVIIAFDSDVMLKANLHEAMARLSRLLRHRGAEVAYCYLPSGPAGEKVGIDDFLAAGNKGRAIIEMAVGELRPGLAETAEAKPVDTFEDVTVEPGWRVLDDLAALLRRYVACTPHQRDAVTLWALHAHALEAFDSTPRLAVLSPEKGSGKSRTLEVLELVVPAPMLAVNCSPAALFRAVAASQPTVLFDEADATFGPRVGQQHEELRGLLNAGHRRGAVAYRVVGDGAANMEVAEFPAFAAVALAGIGDLPDTILDRSVLIRMRRRAPGEVVDAFRRRKAENETNDLRRRAAAWGYRSVDVLATYEPEMPEGIVDRAADVWEPLIAVADLAGGDWPARAREAAVELNAQRAEQDPSLGMKLLIDTKRVFDDALADRMASSDLAEKLAALEESPWGDLRGKAIDNRGLARRLRKYDIFPKVIRIGDSTPRGYLREDFHDAWERYISPGSSGSETTATPQHVAESTATATASATENSPLTCDVASVAHVSQIVGGEGEPVAPNGHVAVAHAQRHLVLDLEDDQ